MMRKAFFNRLPFEVFRRYVRTGKSIPQRSPSTRRALLVGGSITSAVVLYNFNDTFHDSVKHTALTTKRVAVVTQATTRCFYHYKRTLNRTYEDKKEREVALVKCHKMCALITLHALRSNGGIYIKLGQHIGAMTYLLPKEWTDTMIPLQDHCPESTYEEIDELFKEDLGTSIEDMFWEFNKTPIGVASLAQVHVAKLKSSDGKGASVAVKCQHPSLKEFIPLDVMLTRTVFELLDVFFPDYPLTWLGDELQSSIFVELNFTKEAENAERTRKYFSKFRKQTALKIPKVIDSHKRILIMEYVGGKRLDDLEYIDGHGISRGEVSSCLSHIFNNMIFTPNVGIHCDPHGGNLAIRSVKPGKDSGYHNFEIVLFDHGLYRYPSTRTRRLYAKFWLSLLFDKDQAKMKKYAKGFANITDEQFPLLAAAITGRSVDAALNHDISKSRTQEEMDVMASGILEGTLLSDLMSILSRIPSVVLLILKTNDLTRHLDECLQNPLGPERTFLIMTQYCAKTVYDEKIEKIDLEYGKWSIKWMWANFTNWIVYERRINQLYFYDFVLWWKNIVPKAWLSS
ncbi:hypothetical protein SKDZ_12G2840 [Saccharomyces kudriavzevii ZP591]|uniref:YLR253W-like protein n=1 Tax=Saccharomyces cerevisiae x Saccharomyces kudriavzevii (strain VIN7) TaxID=1095631 RepID=H0GYG9_SACCK|nr:YLR253W-like protein [Saccharomyces cerevisiae x Saccharomyces kudriavzevii VIN7]CAI4046582.1 hypothetical protein SKDZ_12G2840 [Saccharomyces kudriavzevii ZP591]